MVKRHKAHTEFSFCTLRGPPHKRHSNAMDRPPCYLGHVRWIPRSRVHHTSNAGFLQCVLLNLSACRSQLTSHHSVLISGSGKIREKEVGGVYCWNCHWAMCGVLCSALCCFHSQQHRSQAGRGRKRRNSGQCRDILILPAEPPLVVSVNCLLFTSLTIGAMQLHTKRLYHHFHRREP